MAEPESGCDHRQNSPAWVEVGNRRRCRTCGLLDFTWSLSRRRIIEALRRAGSPAGSHH